MEWGFEAAGTGESGFCQGVSVWPAAHATAWRLHSDPCEHMATSGYLPKNVAASRINVIVSYQNANSILKYNVEASGASLMLVLLIIRIRAWES